MGSDEFSSMKPLLRGRRLQTEAVIPEIGAIAPSLLYFPAPGVK